ncbi:MAG: hypothetical protein ACXWUG_10985 [Polyangiales bacterium]
MRLVASVVAVSMALSSVPAFASSESDAKDLFTRGRDLRKNGDCPGAITLFSKAYQLYPQGLGSLRNLAECEEQIGKFASARRDWLDLKRALIVNKDAKYEGWDADADAAAARLEPKVVRLTLAITVMSSEGAGPLTPDMPIRVIVNGEAIDVKLIDVPLDRDPGTYLVRIEGGKELVQKSVTLAAGEKKTLELKVVLPEKEAPKLPPEQPQPKPDKMEGSRAPLRTAGFVSIGVGGAALIGTVVAIALRGSAKSDLEKDCPNYASGTCPTQAGKDDADRGARWATMANVFGAITIVGLGVGAGLVIAGAPQEKKTSVKLAPWAGPSGGGATLWGAF